MSTTRLLPMVGKAREKALEKAGLKGEDWEVYYDTKTGAIIFLPKKKKKIAIIF